jgi:hypothetical protein
MANTTIGFGAVLVLIGLIGFVATGSQAPTALIPAAFGFVLIALGIIARNEKMRKHAMHGAAVIGLLGFLGSAGGLWQLVQMMSGTEVARPEAAVARSIMAIVCVAFVAMTVRSFIAARKARAAQ